MIKDTGVKKLGSFLKNYKILYAISGGIAATESVKVIRELRRYEANLTVMMSKEAEKIITPLAVSWALDLEITTEWDPKMKQLGEFDAILVAPATRNTISKHIHGIIDSPMMMALSAARGTNTPILFIPSMHKDIFDDPVTDKLITKLILEGSYVLNSSENEGKIKQPNPIHIVAKLCNLVNSNKNFRKNIAITLGSTRSPIDNVRYIQNLSSGKTGWALSEYLYRDGHKITCIVGNTTNNPKFPLDNIQNCPTPVQMLDSCKAIALSKNPPNVWIHAAAVLDYTATKENKKMPSGKRVWPVSLIPTVKHISELTPYIGDAIRIGFKLESNIIKDELIDIAKTQLNNYDLSAVVANINEHVHDLSNPRGYLVNKNDSIKILNTTEDLCFELNAIISKI